MTCAVCGFSLEGPEQEGNFVHHCADQSEPVACGERIVVCNCESVHGIHAVFCPSNNRASAAKV